MGITALATGPGRRLARRLLPAPGEGPTREQIERGFFELRLFGEGEGRVGAVRVRGDKDPGYGATAHMLSESGVALALDGDRLGATGIVTPASAMGEVLVERLARVGITFEPMDPAGPEAGGG